jgi:AcrR family transcriptional regulator
MVEKSGEFHPEFSRFSKMTPALSKSAKPQRLDRETWLAVALDFLAQTGGRLRIAELVEHLGVSKGSFYWHFRDREDFVRSVLDYWARQFTNIVAETIDGIEDGPEQRLLAVMEMVVFQRLARYDVAMRALAAEEPLAAQSVQRVDQFRLDYARSLFLDMGFTNEEATMRAQTFIGFHSVEPSIISDESQEEMQDIIRRRHAFFVKP